MASVNWAPEGGTIETLDDGTPRIWRAPDMMATEYDVTAFLRSLVLMMKPRVAVETGCYDGHTTLAIEQALLLNDCGVLYTCDLDANKVHEVRNKTGSAVIATTQTGVSLINSLAHVDFAFLDSSDNRAEEALALVDKLNPSAIVALHDSRRPQAQEIQQLTGWRWIQFPTPRGLMLFQQ